MRSRSLFSLGVLERQGHDESCAFVQLALGGYRASMAVGNSAADREADARPFIFVAAMQSLEHREDLFGIFLLEPDPVVLDRQFAKLVDRFRFAPSAEVAFENLAVDFDHRLRIRWLKLQR